MIELCVHVFNVSQPKDFILYCNFQLLKFVHREYGKLEVLLTHTMG